MGIKEIFTESTANKYVRAIKMAPREVICSPRLLLSAALYAMAGIPISTISPIALLLAPLSL